MPWSVALEWGRLHKVFVYGVLRFLKILGTQRLKMVRFNILNTEVYFNLDDYHFKLINLWHLDFHRNILRKLLLTT